MSKKTLPGATLLAPLPAVMVSVGDNDNANVITVAWTGIVCSQPPRLYCGIRSGRDIDKFAEMGFTKERGDVVAAPMIAESPINLECKVFDVLPLGSHDMFLADIVAVHADEGIIVDGKIDYAAARLVNYQHGEYYATGRQLGRFGFAAQKKFISRYGKGVNAVLPKGGLTRRKRK